MRRVRKVGAPLGVLIALGTVAGLIVILLTAVNPVGTAIGFVLSSIAMTVVVLAYLWLDRWEPEPPRLLVFAFLWGTSAAVVIASVLQIFLEAWLNPGVGPRGSAAISPFTLVVGAPVTEEAAKGLFLLLMMTGVRRNELNSLTDCLVYAGLVGAGFAWLEDILYIANGETLADSLFTAALRLIMSPFAHSLFTTLFAIGVWYRAAQAKRHRQGRLHPARLRRRGDPARHVERLVAAGRRGLLRPVRVLDGADLRAGDHARGQEPAPGAARRRPTNCPAWSPRAW